MSTGATTGFSASQKKMALFYVIAIVLGVLNGYVGTDLTVQGGDLIANIFVRLFKFIAIPVIAVSIIATLGRTTRAQDSANIFRQYFPPHDFLHVADDDFGGLSCCRPLFYVCTGKRYDGLGRGSRRHRSTLLHGVPALGHSQ